MHRLVRLVARFFDAPLAVVDLPGWNRQVWHAADRPNGSTRVPVASTAGVDTRRASLPDESPPGGVEPGNSGRGHPSARTAFPRASLDLSPFRGVVAQHGVLVAPDVATDPRLSGTGSAGARSAGASRVPPSEAVPPIHFFAGISLLGSDGASVGMLCVMDTRPHPSLTGASPETPTETAGDPERAVADALADFAAMAVGRMDALEAARSSAEAARTSAEEARSSAEAAHEAAREEADSLERLKSALLVNVNHELRTPVTAIRLLADTLADTLSGNELRLCAKILTQTERLDGVLSSILELSQLENDTVQISRAPVDLRDLLATLADSLRASLPADSDVTVVTDLPDAPVEVLADARILRKVLRKCTENAAKFTAEGTIRLALTADEDEVQFVIEDTGVGIHPDNLARIFEPFYQESHGNARQFEGAGLGLTIARELLHRLGSTIDVTSAKGDGTRVVVSMPRETRGEGRG